MGYFKHPEFQMTAEWFRGVVQEAAEYESLKQGQWSINIDWRIIRLQ
jgi:hypothetical protein